MARHISFSMTTEQVRNKTKTVTRRIGWWTLQPWTFLQPIEKGMGLKRGEKQVKIGGLIRVVSVRTEHLADITPEEIGKEGFPGMTCGEFMELFLQGRRKHNGMLTRVNRIEFEYVEDGGQ